MQFGPADWSFLPNMFERMKSVLPFIKISDWPFLRGTVDIATTSLHKILKNLIITIQTSFRVALMQSHRGSIHSPHNILNIIMNE